MLPISLRNIYLVGVANITSSNFTFFAFLVNFFASFFAQRAAKNFRLLYFYFLLQMMLIWSVARLILCLMSSRYIEHPHPKRRRKKSVKNVQAHQHPSLARPVLSDLQKARRFLSTVLPIVRSSQNLITLLLRTQYFNPITPSHSFMFTRHQVC